MSTTSRKPILSIVTPPGHCGTYPHTPFVNIDKESVYLLPLRTKPSTPPLLRHLNLCHTHGGPDAHLYTRLLATPKLAPHLYFRYYLAHHLPRYNNKSLSVQPLPPVRQPQALLREIAISPHYLHIDSSPHTTY